MSRTVLDRLKTYETVLRARESEWMRAMEDARTRLQETQRTLSDVIDLRMAAEAEAAAAVSALEEGEP